jgi:kinetochore protein Fta7
MGPSVLDLLRRLTFVLLKDHPVLRRLERFSERQGYDNEAETKDNGVIKDNEIALCDVCIWICDAFWSCSADLKNQIEADSNLRPFVEQLRSHLESMQSNASQIAGIRDAIARSQASLNLLPLE